MGEESDGAESKKRRVSKDPLPTIQEGEGPEAGQASSSNVPIQASVAARVNEIESRPHMREGGRRRSRSPLPDVLRRQRAGAPRIPPETMGGPATDLFSDELYVHGNFDVRENFKECSRAHNESYFCANGLDLGELPIDCRQRRKKPVPGLHQFKAKSRFCVHGHKDPDGGYRTFAPTPTTEALHMVLQIIADEGLHLLFADVKAAFAQSDKLVGLRRSLLDPCVYVKHDHKGNVELLVLIEVDDFIVAAKDEKTQQAAKEKLQSRFQFGKWETDAADFIGRRVRREGRDVYLGQEKYIIEKVQAVHLSRGCRSSKESLLTEEEFKEYRSMLYRLSWLAHQTRPEAAGVVSILSSRLHQATVHDVILLNKMVGHLRSTSKQPLRLRGVKKDELKFIGISDAGGVDGDIRGVGKDGGVAPDLLRDLAFGNVVVKDWHKSLSPYLIYLPEECELLARQEQCQITDAKSLYDAIYKQCPASRQDQKAGSEIRWTPHPRMPVDTMTKVDFAKSNGALLHLLRTGALRIDKEEAEMMRRKRDVLARSRTRGSSEKMLAEDDELYYMTIISNLVWCVK
eukprot:s4112_g9.t3